MIKNKNRKELIELVYSMEAENQSLTTCAIEQHEMITEISDLFNYKGSFLSKIWSYITLPFKLNKQLNQHSKYLYTYELDKFNIMNQEQLLEALDYINDFENKKVSPILYMSYVERVTGLKLCKSCGSTNNRLHNDFQRRVLNSMRNNFPYLSQPISLVSGRYGNKHYADTIPYYTFKHLSNLLLKMNKDLNAFKKRGLTAAIDELEVDIKTLTEYIIKRKESSAQEPIKEVISKPLESIVSPSKPKKVLTPVAVPKVQEKPITEPVEVSKPINKVVKELPKTYKEEVKVSNGFNLELALKLKSEGMSNRKIAKEIGSSAATVGRRLNAHTAKNTPKKVTKTVKENATPGSTKGGMFNYTPTYK